MTKLSAKKIEEKLKKEIPVTKALAFQILKVNALECLLSAKLKANINHKGTAFGGSQYSICTVSAYALVLRWLSENNIQTDNIVIAEGNIKYRRPVMNDFKVIAKFESEPRQEEGRATFFIECYVIDKKNKCSEYSARFVARF